MSSGNKKKGLVHINTGDGKGKTTASIGLAVRAAGSGLKVLFVQFFKLDSDPSGEKNIFRESIPAIELIRSNRRHPFFTKDATDHEKVRASIRETFEVAKERLKRGDYGLVVLDEVLGAVNGEYISIEEMQEFLDTRPDGLEVVLTGRDAPTELVKSADYVTEMLKIKHPFDDGIKARRGVEF